MMSVRPTRISVKLLLSFAAVLFCAAQALAQPQPYPNQPIRLVIGYAAGGTTDILARSLAEQLSKTLGQPVVVENKAGAAGNLAAAYVSQAKPDGYVLFMATLASHGINPALYQTGLGYDPVKSFEPISMVAAIPMLLVVNPKLPVNSVPELIAYAKQKPGQLNYASSGNGSPVHLSGAIFADAAKIDVVHIPYRGGAIANTSVMSGDTQYTFASMPAAMPQVQAGKLRALAVTTAKRTMAAPDIPSMAESGLPGFDHSNWYGVWGPSGLPREVVAKLSAAIAATMQKKEVRDRLIDLGADPVDGISPSQFEAYAQSELARFAKIVKQAGVKLE